MEQMNLLEHHEKILALEKLLLNEIDITISWDPAIDFNIGYGISILKPSLNGVVHIKGSKTGRISSVGFWNEQGNPSYSYDKQMEFELVIPVLRKDRIKHALQISRDFFNKKRNKARSRHTII